jgi:hypothetical protein
MSQPVRIKFGFVNTMRRLAAKRGGSADAVVRLITYRSHPSITGSLVRLVHCAVEWRDEEDDLRLRYLHLLPVAGQVPSTCVGSTTINCPAGEQSVSRQAGCSR